MSYIGVIGNIGALAGLSFLSLRTKRGGYFQKGSRVLTTASNVRAGELQGPTSDLIS